MAIIVIGGSAGALSPLRRIVAALPKDFRPSVFVVLHTAPDSPGLLPDVLERAGELPAACSCAPTCRPQWSPARTVKTISAAASARRQIHPRAYFAGLRSTGISLRVTVSRPAAAARISLTFSFMAARERARRRPCLTLSMSRTARC